MVNEYYKMMVCVSCAHDGGKHSSHNFSSTKGMTD
jgi:hypothetical protein